MLGLRITVACYRWFGRPLSLVLVHAIVRSDYAGAFAVVLVDGDDVVQRAVGPIADPVDGAPFVEDVRTFKVYVEDADQLVELQLGQWQWSLGTVASLPVARD